jgi:hypothetical protein
LNNYPVIHRAGADAKVVQAGETAQKHGCTQFSSVSKSLIKKGKMALSTETGAL